ncbi:antirestriction protein ArdC [Novosphingobium sp. SG916]|nr:antirestriction protein ArdC [Novosphingobium sp. SG919]NMN85154.1 antirestriction protein ArdC [Novosphingobium sp. SG916]
MTIPVAPIAPELAIAGADRVIQGSGVTFRIGGGEAFYSPSHDVVQVPPRVGWTGTSPASSVLRPMQKRKW